MYKPQYKSMKQSPIYVYIYIYKEYEILNMKIKEKINEKIYINLSIKINN